MDTNFNIALWGFDGRFSGNESSLIICLPIFKINNETRLGVASILPWSVDDDETIRWLPNEARANEIGTQLIFSNTQKLLQGDVVLIFGSNYLNYFREINEEDINVLTKNLIVIQNGFAAKIGKLNELEKFCKSIGELVNNYFETELKQQKCQKITDKAKACFRILLGTPKVLEHEDIRRELLIFNIEEKYGDFLDSLELGAIQLNTSVDELEKEVSKYKGFLLRGFDYGLPKEIQRAKKIYDAAIDNDGDWKFLIEKYSTLSEAEKILINSFYYQDETQKEENDLSDFQKTLKIFQDELIDKIHELEKAEYLSSNNPFALVGNKAIDSIGESEREHGKNIFAFPMFLTMDKERQGFFLIPYAKLDRLGLLVPGNNLIARTLYKDTSKQINLSDIIKTAVSHSFKILFLENYAMQEIVKQCASRHSILNYKTQPIVSTAKEKGFNYIPDIKDDNTIFLFDLGDAQKVLNDISEANKNKNIKLSSSKIYKKIKIDVNISVGIGFNIYMLNWIIEHDRWTSIEEWVLNFIKNSKFCEYLDEIGILVNTSTNNLIEKEILSDNIVNFPGKKHASN